MIFVNMVVQSNFENLLYYIFWSSRKFLHPTDTVLFTHTGHFNIKKEKENSKATEQLLMFEVTDLRVLTGTRVYMTV